MCISFDLLNWVIYTNYIIYNKYIDMFYCPFLKYNDEINKKDIEINYFIQVHDKN